MPDPSPALDLRPLHRDELHLLHEAFAEAFSDYVVPFDQTPAQLRQLLMRRGWAPELSVGAFEGDRMIGFTLTGRGTWGGKRTAYDTGTGVVPSHRGRGIGAAIFRAAMPLFDRAALERVLLEVITTNEPAVRLYRRLGFRTDRRLVCWAWDGEGKRGRTELGTLDALPWDEVEGWHESAPSWQNGRESLRRASPAPAVVALEEGGRLAGYALVFESGDLAQLAVHPELRRRGLGRELLAGARRIAGKPLRIVNVDAEAAGTIEFLRRCGARVTVEQWEMTMDLGEPGPP